MSPILTPTEVDHYQLQRTIDVYVAPIRRRSRQARAATSPKLSPTRNCRPTLRINMRGLVITMQSSFRSFGIGLLLADSAGLPDSGRAVRFVHRSVPDRARRAHRAHRRDAHAGFTDTTLNIQSLMGIVMLHGMVVSNSILIVDFANVLRSEGRSVREAVAHACRIRLRPILMTSLATVVGLLPMAFKLETGSEAYAPLARVIIGGLTASMLLTIFVVPAAYLLIYRRRAEAGARAVAAGGAANASLRIRFYLLIASFAALGSAPLLRANAPAARAGAHAAAAAASAPSAQATQSLTLQEAEKIAIQNHPQIQAAIVSRRRRESASHRSPLRLLSRTRTAALTGVNAENNSRIAAGALNNPIIYDRFADGVTVEPTRHRFWPHARAGRRVRNLHAKAQQENVVTTRADVLLRGRRRLLRRPEGAGRAASRARKP